MGCRTSLATAASLIQGKGRDLLETTGRKAVVRVRVARVIEVVRGVPGDDGGLRKNFWSSALTRPIDGRRDRPRREHCVTQELNVLALIKGVERFIFVYDDDHTDALIDDIRHKAADPTVSLNWFDAAVLTERVRNPTTEPNPADLMDG
jgi:hypothetical protein